MIQGATRQRGLALAVAMSAACSSGRPQARAAEDRSGKNAGVVAVLGGDCSFARDVAARAEEIGWPALFGDSAHLLATADLAIVNLESPLAPCLPGGEVNRPRLCGDARAIGALRAAGIDAVTLANNHALDAGEAGLDATVQALREGGITALGVEAVRTGKPTAEDLGGIAVVAANVTPAAHQPGSSVPIPSPAAIADAVSDSRRLAPDRPVLVLLHLGREMDFGPQSRDRAYAQPAVRAGASAVVMHGAHVIRSLGEERGVPVHLGLGNLLFDQRDPRAHRGALLSLRLRPGEPGEVVEVSCVDPLSSRAIACDGAIN